MGNSNRTALLNKTHRVLKQHYTSVAPPAERPLLEHLVFATVLENAPFEIAEKIYTHLSKNFFDWNEVRVSTLTELSEVTRSLPDPLAAASNLKRILQGVFESTYSFDLEPVKKQNISQGIKQLERLGGTTPFSLAYVTQAALSGHAIPLDRGALDVLAIVGVISESEAQSGKLNGLERVIAKTKGVEFGSLLHQLAAEYVANPFSVSVRKMLLSINPEAKDRFPKRGAKKVEVREEPRSAAHPASSHAAAAPRGAADHPAKKHLADGKAKHAVEKTPSEKPAAKGSAAKEPEKVLEKASAKSAARPAQKLGERAAEKPPAKSAEKAAAKPSADKAAHAAHKKPVAGGAKHVDHKRSEAKHADAKHADAKHADAKHRAAAKSHPVAAKHKSASKQLSKRKPR
jgi:endonuclease-3